MIKMNKIYIKARAKVNLTLEVLKKRPDNYHEIRSIFQKVNLYDEITIYKIKEQDIEIEGNINLKKEENIIYKAYMKIREKYNIGGVKVILNKKIPMQAGLAGGSTNASAFIIGINKLFDLKLNKDEIESIGAEIGADVVPCLYNKAVLAEGIGEKITQIENDFKYYLVIIKPKKICCNTKLMYKKLDEEGNFKENNNYVEIIESLKNKNIEKLGHNMYNVFELVTDQEIINIKKELMKNGAINSLLAGSGSAVFGVFKDKEEAKRTYKKLKEKYESFICTSYNSKRSMYD
jgi:4-diphosphocytidyl-2-C-methyl-D-erythritol kinase